MEKSLVARINRIEGQVRGIRKMIEENRDCFEVLRQVSAISGAIHSLEKEILESYVGSCIDEALRRKDERPRIVHELVEHLRACMK